MKKGEAYWFSAHQSTTDFKTKLPVAHSLNFKVNQFTWLYIPTKRGYSDLDVLVETGKVLQWDLS